MPYPVGQLTYPSWGPMPGLQAGPPTPAQLLPPAPTPMPGIGYTSPMTGLTATFPARPWAPRPIGYSFTPTFGATYVGTPQAQTIAPQVVSAPSYGMATLPPTAPYLPALYGAMGPQPGTATGIGHDMPTPHPIEYGGFAPPQAETAPSQPFKAPAKGPTYQAPPAQVQAMGLGGWYQQFQAEHGGQTPEQYYAVTEGTQGTAQGLAHALADLEWSQQFAADKGRPPNEYEWNWWYYQKQGLPQPGGGGGGGGDEQRPPLFVPPQVTWKV